MTTTTPAVSAKPALTQNAHLSFGGTLRSEWIKLRSLRSTIWCYGIVIVVTVSFGLLLAQVGFGQSPLGSEAMTPELQQSNAIMVSTLGISFSQLVAAVLDGKDPIGAVGRAVERGAQQTVVPNG